MDIVDQKQDQAIYNIIKVYLAQMNSAMKISKIICEHSDEEELTGDHIICGLIYRLMVPMTDEDMSESLNKADNILNDSEDESDLDEEISYEIPKEKRVLKMNNCNCDICVKCRECISGYESYETYDPMVTRFKESIKETCDKHNIYIN
tara:strand:- start:65 stop:511 length:447 start_codon:yes stop_codon:yes gene_type:complete